MLPAQKPFLSWVFLGNIVLLLHIVQLTMKTINYMKLENKNNTEDFFKKIQETSILN